MTLPLVASLSEDALRAVPGRCGRRRTALGATKFETAVRVVLPAAISGVIASFILAISRAIGETMIVAMAAGSRPSGMGAAGPWDAAREHADDDRVSSPRRSVETCPVVPSSSIRSLALVSCSS